MFRDLCYCAMFATTFFFINCLEVVSIVSENNTQKEYINKEEKHEERILLHEERILLHEERILLHEENNTKEPKKEYTSHNEPASERCPYGMTRCKDKCVFLDMDNENCGACGISCKRWNGYCWPGYCAEKHCMYEPCFPDECYCIPWGCHNLANDEFHCGACQHRCNSDEKCEQGKCVKN